MFGVRVVEAEFCALVTGQITPPGVDSETVKMVSQAARNAVTDLRKQALEQALSS